MEVLDQRTVHIMADSIDAKEEKTWVQILSPSLTSWVASDKLLNVSMLYFPCP